MNVLQHFSLAGGAAVVTGGSKGIGRAIALAFADAGADVVIAARNRRELERTVAEIEQRGRKGFGVIADVSVPADVARLALEAFNFLGSITIWLNNVGGTSMARPVGDLSLAEYHALLDVNLKPIWASAVEAPNRMAAGASMINISSRAAAPGPNVGLGLYAAAKAAVNSLTVTLASELAPRIRVNAIAPGAVQTEGFWERRGMTPDQADQLPPPASTPLQRYGTPLDIACAAVFLASPASSWITGQCLYVSGGR